MDAFRADTLSTPKHRTIFLGGEFVPLLGARFAILPTPRVVSAELRRAGEADCLRATLPELVGGINQAAAWTVPVQLLTILDALFCYDAWRACTLTSDGSYGLAHCLLSCVSQEHTLWSEVAPGILEILNTWLRPEVPWLVIPDFATLSIAMFGEYWWQIVGVGLAETSVYRVIRSLRELRPSFLPGLVQWVPRDCSACELPDLQAN